MAPTCHDEPEQELHDSQATARRKSRIVDKFCEPAGAEIIDVLMLLSANRRFGLGPGTDP
jgi:F0F1-type ATP synthase delta subunit